VASRRTCRSSADPSARTGDDDDTAIFLGIVLAIFVVVLGHAAQ